MIARRIFCLEKPSITKHIFIKISGDKYFANRIIIISSISSGNTTILNCPISSSDIKLCLGFPVAIGAKILLKNNSILIHGTKGNIPNKVNFSCGESGTLTRIVLSISTLLEKEIQFVINGTMKKRPIYPFLEDLKKIGICYEESNNTYKLSSTKKLYKFYDFSTRTISSQLISGTIIFGALQTNSIYIKVSNPEPVSKNYINLTRKCVSLFGGKTKENSKFLKVYPSNYKTPGVITIPDDPCSTLYLITLCILLKWKMYFSFTKKKIVIGEWKVLNILKKMGCIFKDCGTNISICTSKNIKPITESLKDLPDNAPTLLFLCGISTGISKIYNISHLEYKESNRIVAMKEFFSKIGVIFKEKNNCILIKGNPNILRKNNGNPLFLKKESIILDAKYDHRISIIFLIASIIFPSLWVKKFEGIEKSFPDFWTILREMNIRYSEKIL